MDKLLINQLSPEYLRGKRVFVRIDVDGEETPAGVVFDENKLRASLPTFEYLTSAGARVIIGPHLGDPTAGGIDLLRLDPVGAALSRLMDRPVRKLHDVVGEQVLRAVTEMQNGDLVLLENLFFHSGEDTNDPEFAGELVELCDVYCNDAFALAYRGMASTLGITRHVRHAAAGLALARELSMFELLLDSPDLPFLALIGGGRIKEKLPILENLLPRLNVLFIGGALQSLEKTRNRGRPPFTLVLTRHTEDQHAIQMLAAGADGYLNKSKPPDTILDAIRKVSRGGKFVS